MNSIEQIDTENDTKSLISSFIKLIGLAKLTKQVNFKRKSTISLTMIISWLMSVHFARLSLFKHSRGSISWAQLFIKAGLCLQPWKQE